MLKMYLVRSYVMKFLLPKEYDLFRGSSSGGTRVATSSGASSPFSLMVVTTCFSCGRPPKE